MHSAKGTARLQTALGAAGAAAPAAIPGALEAAAIQETDTTKDVHPMIQEQISLAPEYQADIVIIGAGPAGYVAAIRAAQLGARTVIIEKNSVGGTCLNVGCIPTKVLLGSIEALDTVRNASEFGIRAESKGVDFSRMMDRKEKVVRQLTSGVEALFRKNKVRLVRGIGRIADAHTVIAQTAEGEQTIDCDKILIATGSVPASLPVPGLEIGGNVWTSTEALTFDKAPKSLLVIGAGAIGLEAGYMFARLGTEVTVVEMMPQVLPAADSEIADHLQKGLEKAGISFLLNATVARAEDAKAGKKVFIKTESGETEREAEKVLVAVGRRAVLGGIGLDEVGVRHDNRRILVNEHMQTSVPNIYAAGDCIGEPMLAHVGWTEGIVAVEHACGLNSRMDYSAFPACVYAKPECASVGLTEQQARERYPEISTGKFSFSHNGKAMGIGETEGFVKVVSEPRYGQILGVHIVGPHATDLIAEAVLAIRNELTVNEVFSSIHPHPTLSEVVQEAAYDAVGRAIHK